MIGLKSVVVASIIQDAGWFQILLDTMETIHASIATVAHYHWIAGQCLAPAAVFDLLHHTHCLNNAHYYNLFLIKALQYIPCC